MTCRLGFYKKYFKLTGLFFLILFLLCGCSIFSKKTQTFDCKIFSPACGNDEITYYNHCQAEEYNVEISYEGACNGSLIKTVPHEVEGL